MRLQKSDYILGEGEKDAQRLDLQNTLFRDKLVNAFEIAQSIQNLKGLTVLDFGCGVSSAYQTIIEFIGDSGKYIGIDTSEKQISTLKKKFTDIYYIHGDETDSEVIQIISSADIVFMRFVIMHQKNQVSFIQNIYSNMKPGAMLIIQEPEGTAERRTEMVKQYPHSEILCDFKSKLGKGLGLDYDFARNLKTILESFKPKKIIYNPENLYITTLQAKILLKDNIESVAEKALDKGIVTNDYINEYMQAISKLPSDDKQYWFLDLLHTFVVLK